MAAPLRVSFHGLDHSEAVETEIKDRFARLVARCDRITSARVVVEAHHNSHTHLNATHRPFRVTINVAVPGEALTANHDDKNLKTHVDIESAIKESFRALERKLKRYVERKGATRRRSKDSGLDSD